LEEIHEGGIASLHLDGARLSDALHYAEDQESAEGIVQEDGHLLLVWRPSNRAVQSVRGPDA
jgi:hypothetical protein